MEWGETYKYGDNYYFVMLHTQILSSPDIIAVQQEKNYTVKVEAMNLSHSMSATIKRLQLIKSRSANEHSS